MKRMLLTLVMAPLMAMAAETKPVANVNVFGPGEQTTYQVSWLGIVAGTAQVTVGWKMEQFGQPVWPLLCAGETASIASAYSVKDRFISYFNPVTQTAAGADFFVSEGKWKNRERYRYDEQAQRAFVTSRTNGREPVDRDYETRPGTMDLASAAFKMRNTPFKVGDVIETPVFTGHKAYIMRVTVEAREEIETPIGKLDTFRTSITTDFNGQMKTSGTIQMHFTADKKQLPVRAQAEFALGHVVLEVLRYEPGRLGGEL